MTSLSTDRLNGLSTSVAVKAPVKAVAIANITLSGEQTVNGTAVVEGDRVLVTAQTSSVDNGIYDVSTSAWTRSSDFDGNRDVVCGTLVIKPTTGGRGAMYQVTSADPITIDTSSITFDLLDDPAITYDQTALELADGLTPTNTYWPTGHVRRYGVTLDGVTDDSTALQVTADFCRDSGVPIIGDVGTAKIGATFVLQCAGDLSMMTISCPSTTISPAVRVGVITAGPTQLNGSLKLPKVVNSTKPVTGWASQQIGVELAELYQADIYVSCVYGFAVGLDCGGYTSGFAYNTVKIGMLSENKIPLRVGGKATTGWANQNTFLGGRLFISSGEGSLGSEIAGSRYIQLTPTAATSTGTDWPNGNTFIGQTLEWNAPEYLLEIAGQYNQFIGCRFEATAPPVLLTGHATNTETAHNQIIGGYNAAGIVFTNSGVALYNQVISGTTTSVGGSGVCMNLKNESSGAYPLLQGFPAGATEQHLNAGTGATEWTVRLSADDLQGKAIGDATPRVDIDFTTGVASFYRTMLTAAAGSAAAGVVSLGNTTQATVGAAGGASALPGAPTGYLKIYIGATQFVIPYWAQA